MVQFITTDRCIYGKITVSLLKYARAGCVRTGTRPLSLSLVLGGQRGGWSACRSLDWRKLRFDLSLIELVANKRKQFPNPSMSRSNASGQDLPLEVILSLQRTLNFQDSSDVDMFDGVAGQFDTVGFLNQLFPTG